MHEAPDPAAQGARPTPTPTPSEVWRALLPEAVLAGGAVPWLAADAIDHLGDPDGERVELLAGRAVVVPRRALGHLRVTGADRLAFVHGLLSHDVAGLPEGGAVDALLLDHKGQPQAGLGVVRRRDDLFLAVDDGMGEVVRRTFVEHVIFDQVEVTPLDDRLATATLVAATAAGVVAALEAAWPGAVAGLADALEAFGGPAGASPTEPVASTASVARTASVATGAGRVLLRPRRFGGGWAVDVHLLAADLALAWPRWSAAGVRAVGERAWTAGRVAQGVASARGEGRLGLPQECGLEGRVSYRKGCYLGQEIMARIEARGRLRRGLRLLQLAGPPPGLGSARGWRLVDAEGRVVGALGSAAPAPDGAGWWALAVVRLDAAAGEGWSVVAEGDPPRVGPASTPASLRSVGAGW